jgi:mannosyltransferase OCH1-like enzyme
MIPKILHQIWLGGEMPVEIARHVETVARHHANGWSHIIWSERMLEVALGVNVPVLKEDLGTWASVTNYLRLDLLDAFGGVYLDCDIEAVGSLDGLLGHSAFAAEQDPGRICNAVMAAEPAHPWIRWQIDHFPDFDQKDAASGVYLASAAPRDRLTVVPTEVFYPFLWDAAPDERLCREKTLLIHHWLKSWVSPCAPS